MAQLVGELATDFCGDVRVLKKDRALEILAAAQARTQDEVSIQQGTSLAKKGEKIFSHLGSGRRGDLAGLNASAIANFFRFGKSVGAVASEGFRRGRLRQHARAPVLPIAGPGSRKYFATGVSILAGRIVRGFTAGLAIVSSGNSFNFYLRSFR